MMTNPCTLPCSENSLFELSKQHFADQPVESTTVIINAENDNLPGHLNHSDRDIVVPNHTYVGTMEKVQKSHHDNLSTNATQNEWVNTHYPNFLPTVTCFPANANWCIPPFKKTHVSLDPVLLISPIRHLHDITLTLVMLSPSSKDSTSSNLLNRKLTLELTPSKQDRHCIRRIPIVCKVPVPPL